MSKLDYFERLLEIERNAYPRELDFIYREYYKYKASCVCNNCEHFDATYNECAQIVGEISNMFQYPANIQNRTTFFCAEFTPQEPSN